MSEHKTLLLTGAAGSLGSSLAMQCAQGGHTTVLLDCDRRGLELLSDRMEANGLDQPVLHLLDLSVAGPDDFEELLDAIVRQFGGLDGLVHCAARFESLTPLENISPQEWLNSIQVNLNAAWLLSSMSLKLLRGAPNSRLYFMLEDLPRVAGPLWGPYGVSKHALHALVGQFAAACEGSSIQVLGINPGPLQSPLRSRAYHAENPEAPPAPDFAASQVVELLEGRRKPPDTFVDLSVHTGHTMA